MKKRSGFTLIELLVVIAIIALLMSILMPSLSRVRKQAKATMCIMNLKQWGAIVEIYTSQNNGSFHTGNTAKDCWEYLFRKDYQDDPKIRCCPEATKPASRGGKQPFAAWGIWGDDGASIPYSFTEGDFGSYGENVWIENSESEYFGKGQYWKTPYVSGASNVPMFVGCNWRGSVVNAGGSAVTAPDIQNGAGTGMIDRYMMDRHSGYVGSSFLDYSARKVGMKELFKLKYHRLYDVNKWYEIQEDLGWPEWMQNFKDY